MSGAGGSDQSDDEGAEDGPEASSGDNRGRSRIKKAPNAFRTISEVADELHVAQHVLRFWETKFPQVRPLKRGGGRRYYRPDDIVLLRRISDLLYIQGYTIKGVQRVLREAGGKVPDDVPPPVGDERQIDIADPELPFEAGSTGDAEAEIVRLRQVLEETLRELEALRALLP